MDNIQTWTERCEVHPDHQSGMVTNAMIQMRMQEEIDDLRAEIARLREAMEEYVNTVVKMEGVTFVEYMENAELRAVVESILAEKEKK